MAVFTGPFRRFRAGDFDPVEERFDEGARRRSGHGRSGRGPGRRSDDAAWADDADRHGQALNPTRASGPVPFAEVIRAVLARIEHVHRISVGAQPPVALQPRAVNDVVRLTGELVKNAMAFAPNESPVAVSGYMLDNGGVLIDITDGGVGMSAEEMAQANWRLANPQSARQQPDGAPSGRTGLLVVARLAARHGIQVRLRQAPRSGVTALVWLPGSLVVTDPRRVPAGGQLRAGGQTPARGQPAAGGQTPARGQPRAASGPIPVPRWGGEPSRHAATGGQAGARPDADAVARAVAAARMPRFAASQDQRASGDPAAGPRGSDAAGDLGSAPTWGPQQAAAPGAHPGTMHSGDGPVMPPRSVRETPAAGWPRPTFGEQVRPPLAGVASMGQGRFSSQPASPKEDARLPIFEAVRADWFRRSKPTTSAQAGSAGTHPGGRHAVRWTSPADQDWKAAEAAHDPVAGTATQAGLPKRIPRANLIPGTAAAHVPPPQLPPRSAEALRSRLASYQRGGRAGRHAAGELRRAPPYGLPPSANWPPTGGDATGAGDGSDR
ncbi:MAG: ATP-binding protein [Micromonosporaceae bacterium]